MACVVGGLPHAVSSGMASKVLPRFQPGCMAATVAIASPGCGEGDGLGEGDGDGDGLGEGDGLATPPVHLTPFSVKDVGAVLALDHDPLKPNETLALVAMAAFQLTFAAVTCVPEEVTVAFHAWVTCWPEGKVHASCQPLTGSPRLSTLTFAVNPPGHCDETV
ncbi:hypothetical protein Sme01_63130 [Sphaerisporangium melleum]|uniref:Uncharacterized protein n=1 Tax=Sphaerisporangium melleum TaxID=321316 RepID=A0A917VIF6_9ACTN|nr:hypothetical protein GCM10007964_25220 [Sphaerisporangium melleum]GII73837.1 hypothetical protein Sme01_63130 [Sphaerisporangium melleum]